MDLLEATLDTLRQHPKRHGFALENGRWLLDIPIPQPQFKPWKTPSAWRILHVIDESAKRVTVLQVRHESRPLLPETGQ